MAEKARVVVVDDEADMLATLRDILHLSGYDVRVASSGVQAVELCREVAPACVLMDILMPEVDGVQAGREIQRTAPDILVLYMTANLAAERAQEVLREGTGEVMTKPLDLEYLLHRLEQECC